MKKVMSLNSELAQAQTSIEVQERKVTDLQEKVKKFKGPMGNAQMSFRNSKMVK